MIFLDRKDHFIFCLDFKNLQLKVFKNCLQKKTARTKNFLRNTISRSKQFRNIQEI